MHRKKIYFGAMKMLNLFISLSVVLNYYQIKKYNNNNNKKSIL